MNFIFILRIFTSQHFYELRYNSKVLQIYFGATFNIILNYLSFLKRNLAKQILILMKLFTHVGEGVNRI